MEFELESEVNGNNMMGADECKTTDANTSMPQEHEHEPEAQEQLEPVKELSNLINAQAVKMKRNDDEDPAASFEYGYISKKHKQLKNKSTHQYLQNHHHHHHHHHSMSQDGVTDSQLLENNSMLKINSPVKKIKDSNESFLNEEKSNQLDHGVNVKCSTPMKLTQTATSTTTTTVSTTGKKSKSLPEKAIAIMKEWYDLHFEKPYPNDDERRLMAEKGEISENQVKAWFANKRNRSSNTRAKQKLYRQQTAAMNYAHCLSIPNHLDINNNNQQQTDFNANFNLAGVDEPIDLTSANAALKKDPLYEQFNISVKNNKENMHLDKKLCTPMNLTNALNYETDNCSLRKPSSMASSANMDQINMSSKMVNKSKCRKMPVNLDGQNSIINNTICLINNNYSSSSSNGTDFNQINDNYLNNNDASHVSKPVLTSNKRSYKLKQPRQANDQHHLQYRNMSDPGLYGPSSSSQSQIFTQPHNPQQQEQLLQNIYQQSMQGDLIKNFLFMKNALNCVKIYFR